MNPGAGRPRWRLSGLGTLGQLTSRLLYAAFLVFATYNPTGHSFYHWVQRNDVAAAWRAATAGLVLVAFAVTLRIVVRALGIVGALLCVVVASATVWVMLEAGWLEMADRQAQTWFLQSLNAFVLGVGLCWVQIVGSLDGQLRTVDLTS